MLDLGCISICEQIDTGLIAGGTGDYELTGKFNGRIFSKIQPFTIGDPLIFDTFGIPEHYTLNLDVLDTSGGIIEQIKVMVLGIIKNP